MQVLWYSLQGLKVTTPHLSGASGEGLTETDGDKEDFGIKSDQIFIR